MDGRQFATRRSRTHARTDTPGGSVLDRSLTTGDATPDLLTTSSDQLSLWGSGTEGKGGVGGEGTEPLRNGSRIMAQRKRPTVPEPLVAFDAILRQSRRYRPTEAFYGRVMADFVDVPGLDLAYEAEGIVDWLRNTPKGRQRTDIPRTTLNWLTYAKERALKLARMNGQRGGFGNYNIASGSRQYGPGSTSDEDRETARRLTERARELQP
jgi:hypothetical protein